MLGSHRLGAVIEVLYLVTKLSYGCACTHSALARSTFKWQN